MIKKTHKLQNMIFCVLFIISISFYIPNGLTPQNIDSDIIILPTSEKINQEWVYTFIEPDSNWTESNFNDLNWRKGFAPFGNESKTKWKTPGIWLRKKLYLTQETLPNNPFAVYFHDEDIKVYINKTLILDYPGYTTAYVKAQIRKDIFKIGENIIAIHCIQTTGGQAIDFGMIDMPLLISPTKNSDIHIDFSKKISPDLDKKKYNVYNCPYFKMNRWFRDMPLLAELGCSSLRYDPTWGGHNVGIDLNSPQISGTPENLIYNFSDFDRLTDSLLAYNIEPMYVMAYTPAPLQCVKGIFSEKPTDMNAWQKICRDYAAHWKITKRKVPYYEIWNEPDNQPFFFKGTLAEYCDIYKYGATGIKQGDPDALVGGPAIAAIQYNAEWLYGFIDYVSSNNLPLDFISFHNYGDPEPIIKKTRDYIRKYPAYAKTPLMLTEFNSFMPLTPDFVEGGKIEHHWAASKLLHDFKLLLKYPDVTKVYWAMFNDPDTMERCGLVSLNGHRKAAFNAFKIYMDMPVSQRESESDTKEVEAMASCDMERAAAVVWNLSSCDRLTTISLSNIPQNFNTVHVYRIDKSHASFYDNQQSEKLEIIEEFSIKDKTKINCNELIPCGGLVYITIGNDHKDFIQKPKP